MIRRLRLKFVLMNMAFVTALLAAVFSLVLHTTRNELAQAGLRALEQAALEHLGPVRPDRRPGEPGRVPCFVLRTGPRGELIAAGDGYYDLTDEDWLLTLLAAAQEQGGREGVLEDYGLRFCRSGPPERPVLAFADLSGERQTMAALARTCLLAGSAAFLGFLAVSVLLSRWAVRPVARAWEQQRQFVADASHELKTPLAAIRLLTDSILQNENMDNATAREFVSDIGNEAERLSRITEDLLRLTRLDSGVAEAPRLVEVAPVLERVARMLRPVAEEKGVELLIVSITGAVVLATEGELHQILYNLAENAIKYNRPGGRVRVTAEPGEESTILTVEDNGIGIPAEDLSNVFKRFYRVDKARSRAQGGFGLGLSLCREIAELHRGGIRFENRPEGGACVTVELRGGRR